MPTDLQIVIGMLGDIVRRIENLAAKPEPSHTRKSFAALIGRHPKTISNWVKSGRLITERGLIPASEARKFLS